MRPSQIEAWVLQVIDRIARNSPIEDMRVEAKADWPVPEKAARRIAGHANASRGEYALWIIGLDEDKGVTGAAQKDLATWLPQVQAQFEGLAPMITDLIVPTSDGDVVALLIETDRAPFVVRNPSHGATGGGPVELEVPWRDGTKVRTARRSEILRLLAPLQRVPEIELLEAKITLDIEPGKEVRKAHLYLSFYLVPLIEGRLVIPVHRSECVVRAEGQPEEILPSNLWLQPPMSYHGSHQQVHSQTVSSTPSELIIDGPGIVVLRASLEGPFWKWTSLERFRIDARLRPVLSEQPIVISASVSKDHAAASASSWELER
jgi:hypothetical protein